ncbi:hypothetical protein ACIQXI_07380 [Lysinibacillus sp. NPDC097195]|uniref:hypothetical protein n=1 Tax=Lysinibacillus sp. NPDC097195 TaxID=3364141 RepID=UPI0037FF26B0
MKHSLFFTFLLLVIICLAGCSEEEQNNFPYPEPLLKHQPALDNDYTKELAIATFRKDNGYLNYEISDVVLVKDNALPKLKAVISFYDKENNNSSNLAFIYDNISREICFAVNDIEGVKTYEIDDSSNLTYVGNGAVTTSIRKIDTNKKIDYTITFSHEDATPSTTIKIETAEPTN